MQPDKQPLKRYRWLVIALLLCLISGFGASAVQNSAGAVTVKDLTWEGANGNLLSGYLFVPSTATAETPAPAIVSVEGWYNSKEMQDAFYVELARRGYVVFAIDMPSHGNSQSMTGDHLYDGGGGVDDAAVQLATLKYVDASKIGVTGHSSGGGAAVMAVALDNKRPTPLIAAVMLQAADWIDDEGEDHSGDFGSRSVGIIADQYDDFYFAGRNDAGDVVSYPRDYIGTATAKQFLNFNDDPATFAGTPEAGKYYTRDIDGKSAQRVIYTPPISHIMVPVSTESVGDVVEFFERTFGAPHPLEASNQVWPWKTFFTGIGLAGFCIFMGALTLALTRTRYFSEVASTERPVPAPKPTGAGAAWFWGGMLVSAIFSGLSYLLMVYWVNTMDVPSFFPQKANLMTALWAAACGLFAILVMFLSYQFYGKKNGQSLRETGVTIGWRPLLKTILLSIVVSAATYGLVFVSQYFFTTDYRLWLLTVKAFEPDKLGVALHYMPLFLTYFVANSVAVNCFNYNQLGKREWVNTVVVGFSTNIAAIVIVAMEYGTFFSTGWPLWSYYSSSIIRLIPVIFILFGAVVVSRIVYRRTKNAYLPGIINGVVVTLVTCATSATILS